MLPYIGTPNIQFMDGTGTGVVVTSGATAGAKTTSAVTIGTLNFETSELTVTIFVNTASRRVRVDLYANTGGSDQLIAEDIYSEAGSGGTAAAAAYTLPLRIPSGAVLKAKSASQAAGSASVIVHVTAYSAHPGSADVEFGLLKNLTTLTGLDAPSVTLTGTTYTAWVEVTASTSIDVFDLFVQATNATDVSRTPAGSQLLQIAIGASGSEVVVGEALLCNTGPAVESTVRRIKTGRIPAGTRLSYRVQHSGAAADSFGCNIWGLAA